jgi:hypothetical protein
LRTIRRIVGKSSTTRIFIPLSISFPLLDPWCSA